MIAQRPVATVSLNPPQTADGWLTLSANYRVSGGEARELWFRVPEKWSHAIDHSVNPFVTAFFLKAAQEGHDLHVTGTADTELLVNLDDLLVIWKAWKPDSITRSRLTADREELRTPVGRDAICCASGGIDSSYTLWRHTLERRIDRPEALKAGIFVHGFDIPLEDELGAQQALASVNALLEDTGIECIRVATNYRSVVPDWEVTFGAAAAAILSLFSSAFGRGLLPSGGSPLVTYPWGSTSMTDHLLTSSRMLIKGDGNAISRHLKTAAMAKWETLQKHLRVCWQDKASGRNCGKCEKCVRTYFTLLAAGADNVEAFPRKPTIRDIHHLELYHVFQPEWLENVVELAESNNRGDEPWVRALRTRVVHGRRELAGGVTGAVNRIFRKSWRKIAYR